MFQICAGADRPCDPCGDVNAGSAIEHPAEPGGGNGQEPVYRQTITHLEDGAGAGDEVEAGAGGLRSRPQIVLSMNRSIVVRPQAAAPVRVAWRFVQVSALFVTRDLPLRAES